MRLELGTSFVQLLKDSEPTNTFLSCMLGAISFTPTGNAQGDIYFLSLSLSGFWVSRRWTVLPMTDIAIARVEALALNKDQSLIQERSHVVK